MTVDEAHKEMHRQLDLLTSRHYKVDCAILIGEPCFIYDLLGDTEIHGERNMERQYRELCGAKSMSEFRRLKVQLPGPKGKVQ